MQFIAVEYLIYCILSLTLGYLGIIDVFDSWTYIIKAQSQFVSISLLFSLLIDIHSVLHWQLPLILFCTFTALRSGHTSRCGISCVQTPYIVTTTSYYSVNLFSIIRYKKHSNINIMHVTCDSCISIYIYI